MAHAHSARLEYLTAKLHRERAIYRLAKAGDTAGLVALRLPNLSPISESSAEALCAREWVEHYGDAVKRLAGLVVEIRKEIATHTPAAGAAAKGR